MPRYALLILLLLLSGCAVGRGLIKHAGTQVLGVSDPGKPATLTSGETKRGFRIPANSKIRRTSTAATASTPAVESEEFELSGPSEYQETRSSVDASTGTIDTEVAKKRIDVASKAPFLYAAIACVLGAIGCMIAKFPTAALLSGIGAAAFFALWKMSDLPSWFVCVGVAALAGGAFLILGYKRGEQDANNNGIPDRLETK